MAVVEKVRPKPEGIAYIVEDDPPLMMVMPDGGVMLSVTTDLALRFRTAAAYEAWLMRVVKQAVNP